MFAIRTYGQTTQLKPSANEKLKIQKGPQGVFMAWCCVVHELNIVCYIFHLAYADLLNVCKCSPDQLEFKS